MSSRVEALALAIAKGEKISPLRRLPSAQAAGTAPQWEVALNACAEAALLTSDAVKHTVDAVAAAVATVESFSESELLELMSLPCDRSNPFGKKRSPVWRAPAMQLAAATLNSVNISSAAAHEDEALIAFILACHFFVSVTDASPEEWNGEVMAGFFHSVNKCVAALDAFANGLPDRNNGQAHSGAASEDARFAAAPVSSAPLPIAECFALDIQFKALNSMLVRQVADVNQTERLYRDTMHVLRRLLAADGCGCGANVSNLRCSSPVPTASPLFGNLLKRIASPHIGYFKPIDTSALVRMICVYRPHGVVASVCHFLSKCAGARHRGKLARTFLAQMHPRVWE
jgi:uncharacterized protein YukE